MKTSRKTPKKIVVTNVSIHRGCAFPLCRVCGPHVMCNPMPAPHPTADRSRRALARARRADRPRFGHQDHWSCGIRPRPPACHGGRDHPAQGIQGRRRTPDRDRHRTRGFGFVLGLPIDMDGSEGPRAQSTRAFARNFSRLTVLPIALWDERLSTAAVERELIEWA